MEKQTYCLSQMLPPGIRRLFRKGNRADTVRGDDLWLTCDATGLVRVSQATDKRPTWLLKGAALAGN